MPNLKLVYWDSIQVDFPEMSVSDYVWAESYVDTTIDTSIVNNNNYWAFIVAFAVGDSLQNRMDSIYFPGDVVTHTWMSFKGQAGFYIKNLGYSIYWADNHWKGGATYSGIDLNGGYNNSPVIWNVGPSAGRFWVAGAIIKV